MNPYLNTQFLTYEFLEENLEKEDKLNSYDSTTL